MIELSWGALGRLVAARARLGPDAGDDALLAAARSPRQKMAALLTSARALEGEPMPAAWTDVLRRHQARTVFYSQHVDALTRQVPDVTVFKGQTLARDYPVGFVRGAGDVDLHCASVESQWHAARYLLDTGWYVKAFTLYAPRGNVPEAVVALGHENIPCDSQAPGITLSTSHLLTDLWSPPLALDGARSARATSLVCLFAEQWERAVRTRDLVDYSVAMASATRDDQADLIALTTHARTRHQWWRLRSLCRTAGLAVDDPGPGHAAGASDAAVRAIRAARRRARPVRVAAHLAGWTVDDDRGVLFDAFSDWFHARVGVRRALDAGMPAFGVESDDRRSPALAVEHHHGQAVARTPLGSFRLVVGSCTDDAPTDVSLRAEATAAAEGPIATQNRAGRSAQ